MLGTYLTMTFVKALYNGYFYTIKVFLLAYKIEFYHSENACCAFSMLKVFTA